MRTLKLLVLAPFAAALALACGGGASNDNPQVPTTDMSDAGMGSMDTTMADSGSSMMNSASSMGSSAMDAAATTATDTSSMAADAAAATTDMAMDAGVDAGKKGKGGKGGKGGKKST